LLIENNISNMSQSVFGCSWLKDQLSSWDILKEFDLLLQNKTSSATPMSKTWQTSAGVLGSN